ncbi:MAG TPA: N-acetylmuramoyl-L-alanine amidase [Candidatus Limnocylindria bacterium]|nr:N-acetylmuramoyl-L-alanine amidase [Candidatus Limnocylindria bacterium]
MWPLLAQAVVLERVRVRAEGGAVELSVSHAVVPWVRRLPAAGDLPHRIYIDLPDTVLGPAVRKIITADNGALVRVRTGQFTPTTARIVLDTTTELPYDVTATSRSVTITLQQPRTAPAAADVPQPPQQDPPARQRPPAEAVAAVAPRVPPPRAKPAAPAVEPPEPAAPPGAPPPAAVPQVPLVVVDAGHGGHDPGAEGVDGVQEKTIVLQIAHRLAAKLPARLPVDSLLTRSDDSFVPLAERLPKGSRPPAVFVSLHANACEQPDPRGVEIFFGGPPGSRTVADAKHLARLMTTELRARLLRVRGRPRPGPFRVLTANAAPSVLVEVGYLTHREDAARLQDAKYQELLTDALVDAVATFLQTHGDTMHAGEFLVPSDDAVRTAAVRRPS